MDECVFVAVESVCARRCVRMATGKRKAGMEGILIFRWTEFRAFLLSRYSKVCTLIGVMPSLWPKVP